MGTACPERALLLSVYTIRYNWNLDPRTQSLSHSQLVTDVTSMFPGNRKYRHGDNTLVIANVRDTVSHLEYPGKPSDCLLCLGKRIAPSFNNSYHTNVHLSPHILVTLAVLTGCY